MANQVNYQPESKNIIDDKQLITFKPIVPTSNNPHTFFFLTQVWMPCYHNSLLLLCQNSLTATRNKILTNGLDSTCQNLMVKNLKGSTEKSDHWVN